tara:strand:- start:168 stop:509 length:342 start_codon:yes stop_codon:yes gene_type:complete
MVAMECGSVDKIPELMEKVLGSKLKVKAPKDPNKPKRAKTSFMYYCDQHRPALLANEKKKGNKINIGNIAKALGKSWKKLETDAQKKKWNTLALADKERYEKAIHEYNEKNGL